ncbi:MULTISPECIES: GntR family transcriptional regulator [unclassified Microbacterium]|uniref:GntR family transcriptional regulator n=1 Tax=unclassified Microbacterium TaxID=2609290 RepID=UPI000B36331D|nr:GntR family transcriptional regulator [Microbacterium sp. JB110]RCS57722.1 GntR family transcriptional regulator [Microbacterium sp. JB110]
MFAGDGLLYQQLADRIAEDILVGTYPEGSGVPSTNEYATFYQMSPITAAKGLNLLVEQGVLYKKRGVGMFVAAGARSKLQSRRRAAFTESHVVPLVREARLLHIHKDELAEMIDKEASK